MAEADGKGGGMIVALEGAPSSLKKDASPAVAPPQTANVSTAILGGSLENATPEMIEAAKQGTILGHPALGSNPAVNTAPVKVGGAAELEAAAAKKPKAKE